MVEVASEESGDGLLDRFDDLRRGFEGAPGPGLLEDVLNDAILDLENVDVAHDARGVRRASDQVGDEVAIVDCTPREQVVVGPEVLAPATGSRRGEGEEQAALVGARQAGVDAIRQVFEHAPTSGVEDRAQLTLEKLAARQLGELLLLGDHRTILVADPP
jgi:hypothetical protein